MEAAFKGKERFPMNIFRAAWCRIYQGVFRAAIPLLPYRRPEELAGVAAIPAKLGELGVTSALLVTDGSLRSLGLTKPLEDAMAEKGLALAVFDGTVANPTIANVEAAYALYREKNCGAVIGFGGGSPMDCAKAVAARAGKPGKSIRRMAGNLRIRKKLPPLFAVPTTAGTGSETTLAAVIVDEKTRHKFVMNDFSLIPRYAVLDPETTVGLPPFYTATTGMDALTHAVEAYIGRSTTKDTRAAAVEAVQLIMTYLERAWRDGQDREARRNMLRASFLAGTAFTKSYVGYCHSVAHSLGGQYDTPHGLANAVLLPHILRVYGAKAWRPLRELAVAAGLCGEDLPESVAAELFIREIEAMNRRMDIPATLPGIRPGDIPAMARYADKEGNPLYPVPRLLTRRELEQFYTLVMEDPKEEKTDD